MAIIYVKHTGSNTSPYDTWAKAATTLATAASFASANDRVWVSNNHAESVASAINIAPTASGVEFFCGDDSSEPPIALATTAQITTTGSNIIQITAGADFVAMYFYGINFKATSGAATSGFFAGGSVSSFITFENCTIENGSTGTPTDAIALSSNAASVVTCINCTFKVNSTSSVFSCYGKCNIIGGSYSGAGSTPANVFRCGNNSLMTGQLDIVGLDLSALGTGFNLLVLPTSDSSVQGGRLTMQNCKFPSSWSGVFVSGTWRHPNPQPCAFYDCDAGATNYKFSLQGFFGAVDHETTVVRSGGASDGTTPLSWKIVSGANNKYYASTAQVSDIVRWNDIIGQSLTATVEIIHDSVTNLKDNEVWLEVDYFGASGSPLGATVTDRPATPITAAADQTASSVTWTTTGLTNPNKQKLSVTFTPQMKGLVRARVCLAKASYTVYVDPLLTLE